MLPSFPALRRKNLATLYGSAAADRSPKGSVDARMQDLVDCINQHPDYVTLSSCSGRLAVFDPGSETAQPGDNDNSVYIYGQQQATTTHTNGKGGTGGWLFVSHDLVDTDASRSALLQAMMMTPYNNSNNTTTADGSFSSSSSCSCFHVEPFVLHVAASCGTAGQRLWQAALQAGCRESGLGVTEQRVTVAIRTQRGRLVVPLLPHPRKQRQHTGGDVRSSDHPDDSYSIYTQFVVEQGNERMRQNWAHLRKLHACIETALFSDDRSVVVEPQGPSAWPPVQLVRAAAAAVVADTTESEQKEPTFRCVLLGGYGTGPQIEGAQRRSNAVHMLTPTKDRPLAWETIPPQIPPAVTATSESNSVLLPTPHGPLRVKPIPWTTPRVGATVVPFGRDNDTTTTAAADTGSQLQLLLVVGGHNGPAHPAEPVVVIYDAQKHTAYSIVEDTQAPVMELLQDGDDDDDDDALSRTPSPRWGHTCTPLLAHSSSSWLCVGGRNTSNVLHDDSVVLIQLETDTTTGCAVLSYQRRRPYPIFDHAAVGLPVPDDASSNLKTHVLVHGGLVAIDQLLPPSPAVTAVLLDPSCRRAAPRPIDGAVPDSGAQHHRFGHQLNRIPQRTSVFHWVLMTGGVATPSSDAMEESTSVATAAAATVVGFCVDLLTKPARPRMTPIPLRVEEHPPTTTEIPSALDSVLVHHCAVSLPSCSTPERSRIALVGGGVAGFAFGHAYAPSTLLDVRLHWTTATQPETTRHQQSNMPKKRAEISPVPTNTNAPVPVVYAKRRNAKAVKDTLIQASLLDLQHRITAVDPNGVLATTEIRMDESGDSNDDNNDNTIEWTQYVAIPVLDSGKVESASSLMVVGNGLQVCPFSTRRFAAASAGTILQ